MMPPLRTPGNASCFGSGFQSATTSPFLAKLRIRNPSELAGPQPQHALLGAYVSCREGAAFMTVTHKRPTIFRPTCRDTGAVPGRYKANAAGSSDCDRAALPRARTSRLRVTRQRLAYSVPAGT